ncbi:MAG: hypothetical protein H6577_10760 [Lewinellaceae bacterium]|nr:hypothetical protein [Saprospiraceae bacterium]MCB9338593.1 hypothetical protein [Lewinellaceae bacterium]
MKYIIFFAIGMLISCGMENPTMDVVATNVDIFVEDADGNNLLTGTSTTSINTELIKLIYLINGVDQTAYNPDLDCPRFVCYISDPGSERIRIFPNDTETEEYPITYIDWGNGDMDTLKCHFVRKEYDNASSVVCDKVWFNDLPMFPDSAITEFGRAFKIVK